MTTRRLAAIIAADVAGYSRLMHADEERTHAAFTAIMKGSVEPAVAQYGGRLVKSTGDGFLAEFPSAIEAVRCALQFQDSIARRSSSDPQDQRLFLRVGINLGDVIVEPHDIFGDGVTGQLIDAPTGAHIWADRFDGLFELKDIFELQDKVTASVVGAIEPKLRVAEIERAKRKPTGDLRAYDLWLRALTHFNTLTREGIEEAIRLLERAIEIDPDFALACLLVAVHSW